MDKTFVFNKNNICTNPNTPISWISEGKPSMGWSFDVFTALTPKGWVCGLDCNMGDSCASCGCNRKSRELYGSQKEAIYNSLRRLERLALKKKKSKFQKEMLSEIRKGINLYNFEHDKKCKTVIFVMFGFLLVTLWLAIHFMLIRSLILALLISIGLSYMIITLVLVAWNLAAIRELNKTRMKLESKH